MSAAATLPAVAGDAQTATPLSVVSIELTGALSGSSSPPLTATATTTAMIRIAATIAPTMSGVRDRRVGVA